MANKFFDNRESAQRRYNDHYKPKASGGMFGYGLTSKQFKRSGAKDHLKRAATFATWGSGAKREDMLNTMGMLTKAQKEQAQAGGKLNKLFHAAIPIATFGAMAATMANGGDALDYVMDTAIPEVAAFAGWRTGKSLGYAAGGMMGQGAAEGVLRRGAAGLIGGVTGAVAGFALAAGATHLLKESTNSNNIINRAAHDIRTSDFDNDIMINSNTLTHRRRAAEAISKSRMNDRGQVLGNEAMIMRGIF